MPRPDLLQFHLLLPAVWLPKLQPSLPFPAMVWRHLVEIWLCLIKQIVDSGSCGWMQKTSKMGMAISEIPQLFDVFFITPSREFDLWEYLEIRESILSIAPNMKVENTAANSQSHYIQNGVVIGFYWIYAYP